MARAEAQKVLDLADRIVLQRSKAPESIPESDMLPAASRALDMYWKQASAIIEETRGLPPE